MKSIRVLSTTAMFLILGFAVPAKAGQESQEKEKPPKQEEKAKAPERQQQPKPVKQERAQAPKQEQQAKPQEQQKTQSPKQEQQAKPEQQKAKTPTREQQPKSQEQQKAKEPQPKQQAQQAKSAPQKQHEQQARSSQRPQRTQQAMERQRAQPQLRLSVMSSSRIPEQRFHSNFGRQHNFRISSPRIVGGYSRFQYGGYWFGFVQPWPDGWYYTDNVYIDFVDGGYYLYNPYYPGARISISVVL